ncbi:hypothetical protein F8280_27195 [Micromonospora noduli]|uniref:hypothetical protein n=1 Tax=Micromonospora noduli TaxID=709876 RepID=UPI00124B8CF4|nr:hypothetical protein [Micromonospora noduli]KAB1918998.1 hypothetical protein F8280_27195 [Micromonospora noduli]
MNGRRVAVAATMIVVGVVGLVIGAVALASGNLPMVGLVALGALVAVLGGGLLRDAIRAARLSGQDGRRRRPDADGGGYGFYPMPAGDAGSGHVGRQRDGDHDSSDNTEPAGGSGDSGGGWSGWGWSSGDSGGGWSGGDSSGGWSGGGDSGGGGGSS